MFWSSHLLCVLRDDMNLSRGQKISNSRTGDSVTMSANDAFQKAWRQCCTGLRAAQESESEYGNNASPVEAGAQEDGSRSGTEAR